MITRKHIVAVVAMAALANISAAQTATYPLVLKWTLPTTFLDDTSSITDGEVMPAGILTGVRLYMRNQATQPTPSSLHSAYPPNVTTVTLLLAPGTYCFQATAVGYGTFANGVITGGLESPRSPPAEVCKTIAAPPSPPKPPNPPVLTIASIPGVPYSIVYGVTATKKRSSTVQGLIDVGKPCIPPAIGSYRGDQYMVVTQADVRFMKGVKPSANVAAPCKAVVL